MTKAAKILYGLLFGVLLASPHIIPEHIFFVPKAYAESLTTLVVFAAAFSIHLLYRQTVRNKDREINTVSQKLLAAFKFIGNANRRIPLLKNLTSDLLATPKVNKKEKIQIFQNLLALAAVSIAKVDWCLLRFIDVDKQRTVREYVFTKDKILVIKHKIGNQMLLRSRDYGRMNEPENDLMVISTSEKETVVQGFLVMPFSNPSMFKERWTLQAITDQAQLFFRYLY